MTSPIPSEPRTGHQLYHAAAIAPATAVAVAALGMGTIYAVQILLRAAQLDALLASALGDVVVLGGLALWQRSRPFGASHVGLVAPRRRFVIAAMMLGSSTWYLTLLLAQQLQPPEKPVDLERLIEQSPLVPTLVALSVLPALAEEILFRGVLAHSLARRFGAAASIATSAVVFGVYHLYPPQIVSTFALGLVLAYLTLRAVSIIPAMIVHALNNAIAIVLSRDEVPSIGNWMGSHPFVMLSSSAMLVAGGLALANKGAA